MSYRNWSQAVDDLKKNGTLYDANLRNARIRAVASGYKPTTTDTTGDIRKTMKPKQDPPPTFSEPIIGYRTWTVDAYGDLRPITAAHVPWVPGINEAACEKRKIDHGPLIWPATGGYEGPQHEHRRHHAPNADCYCGLYAYSRYNGIKSGDWENNGHPYIVGSVAAWGRIQVHRNGFRAEKACVTALVLPDGASDRYRELAAQVADRYRVSLVPVDALPLEAQRYASPVPDSVEVPEPEQAATSYHAGYTISNSTAWYTVGNSTNFRIT